MVSPRLRGLSLRSSTLSAAALLVAAGLVTGCGSDEAEPSASPSSSPAPAQVAAEDYAAALDDVEAVAQAGDSFQQAFDSYDQVLRTYLQGDLTDVAAATAAATGGQAYAAASSAYRAAADTLYADPFVVDPEVSAARDAYREQVLATLDSHDAGIAVGFTYVSCRQAQAISLLSAPRHASLADACIEAVEPLTTNAIPEVAAYAEGVTTLMEQRKRAFAAVGEEAGELGRGEGALLDQERLDGVNEQLEAVNAAADRAGRRIDAAYATFRPTLDAVLGEDGAGPALQARYDASSVDASLAALREALEAGGGEG